jgi:hypothetical protein
MINEDNMVAEAKLGSKWYGIFHYPAGKPVFSAERLQQAAAVFDSRPIVLSSNVTSWKEVGWVSNVPTGSRLYVYVRTAATEGELDNAVWSRPLLNGAGEDISSLSGTAMQFRIAMTSGYDPLTGVAVTPSMSSFSASCYVQGAAQAFYTRAVSLGFVPTHVILTYNGSIPADAMVTFAVSTVDSVAPSDFKTIKPNTVEGVEEIAKSTLLKVCVSAVGNTEIPFVIDEFAIAVAGDQFVRIAQ